MPRFGDMGLSGGFGSDLESGTRGDRHGRGGMQGRSSPGSLQGRRNRDGGPARPARPRQPQSGGLGDTMPTPATEPTALSAEEISEQAIARRRRLGRGKTILAGRLGDIGEPLIFRPTLGG